VLNQGVVVGLSWLDDLQRRVHLHRHPEKLK
jgi:hypothetical protein